MRAKLKLTRIIKHDANNEELLFSAVCKNTGYPADGSDENNTFAKFTPCAELRMNVQNPALIGTFTQGQEFYVDFTPANA